MKTAFIFAGQGAQQVGMGRDLYEALPAARRVFDLAEEATRLPLKKLCFEGPADQLSRTDVCQPAIFTVSAAVLACMDDFLGPEGLVGMAPAALTGLSLGEYTALYAAEAMDLPTAVKLVARRGQLMQAAAEARPSGMVTILGLDEQKVAQLCDRAANGQVLSCANFNCPGQIVLSGEIEACRRAAELADRYDAATAIPLDVAGAFHSEIMAPAAEQFKEALDEAQIAEPKVPVLANVDAAAHGGPADIRDKLLAQLVSPVRWQQCMESLLADGVEQFYEIGPGRVLTGLMRRIERRANCTCINSRETIEKLARG